jgi:hypothetical protein
MSSEVQAVCHVHSTWSYDGSWTLEALRDRFRRRGARVLMMTEHDRGFSPERLAEFRGACQRASSQEILVVPGIEYSDAQNRVHVLVWGPVPFLGENLPTAEMLAKVKAANGLAVLAHPTRRDAWKAFEPSWTDHLLGIEAWNRKYDGWAPSKTAPSLLQQSGAVPFVGLDFHTERQSAPLAMALDLDPKNISEDTVLDCLRQRRCYARTWGVPLDHGLVAKASGLLRMAEKSRKTAASIYKSRLKTKKA